MRVSARRLVALLDILETLNSEIPVAELRRSLRRHIRVFGPLRDTQVQIVKARTLAKHFPAFHIGLTVLKVRESSQLKEGRKLFRALDIAALERMIAVARRMSEDYFSTQPDRTLDSVILRGALTRAYVRLALRRSPALTGTPRLVHELRIALKKFRYMSEVLQAALPPRNEGTLNVMKDLQTRVGKVHDQDMLIAGLAGIFGRYRTKAPDQYARMIELLKTERNRLMAEVTARADSVEKLRPDTSRSAC
jgi:CHAD domain-containing protein